MTTTNPAHVITTFDASFVPAALAVLDKVNRKAARAGIENRFEGIYSTATLPGVKDKFGLLGSEREVATFVVLGAPLVIEGWTFVATLSFDAEAGVVTRPVPDAPVVDLAVYRSLKAPICDHCNTSRARKDVFVLLGEGGELKVIGRNCLAAFIGLDPAGAIRYLDAEKSFGELFMNLGGVTVEWRFASSQVIALTSAAVAAYGWVPKSAAWDSVNGPTSGIVSTCLFPLPTNKKQREEAEKVIATVTAKLEEVGGVSRAQERADEVLAWVRDELGGHSEYVNNLKAVLSADTVSERNLGLAVSAVSAWAKAQDRALEQAARAVRGANSEYIGEVKDKLELAVELVQQPRFIDGEYGVSTLLVFADAAGNVIKWFASGSKDFKVGTRFTGKATVKKHEEYNGTKSTVVTRAKLQEV